MTEIWKKKLIFMANMNEDNLMMHYNELND